MHFTEYDTRLAAYVLLTDERRVLLTWFRGDELNPPCWTLPGGGIEFDESLRDAAIRETYEETGYHVSVQRILADSYETAPATSDSRPFRSQRFLYAGTITGGMLGTTETDGSTEFARWMPISELHELESRGTIVDMAIDVLLTGESSASEAASDAQERDHPLKYAVVERERLSVLRSLPDGVTSTRDIIDRYVIGTRLRLREVHDADGTVTHKLSHKIRLGPGPHEVACTNLYLNDEEWNLLNSLPAHTLRKRRHIARQGGTTVAIDQHEDGSLVAEIDDVGQTPADIPDWLDTLQDVTNDEAWTGAGLALARGTARPAAR